MDQVPLVFPLKCSVQNYHWGKVGKDSEVAKLLLSTDPSFSLKEDAPYAELWMGTHPNGPSRIVSNSADADMELSKWVKANDDKLGSVMKEKKDLSFLFKVLSVKQALSIQAHPHKTLAERIHKEHSDIYKDPNHKPEMAIALTQFQGLCGFRPIKQIAKFLFDIPEFNHAVGSKASSLITSSSCYDDKVHYEAIKNCFTDLMNQNPDVIKEQLTCLVKRVTQLEEEGEDTSQYESKTLMKLNSEFPGDVGCFALYFLNIVTLQPGEAMYLRASLPHAYLSGDCIECMACSDNTIRAGLTPKFRDVKLLCAMLDYTCISPVKAKFKPVVRGDTSYFQPDEEDFMVTVVQIPADKKSGVLLSIDSASICIVIQGEGQASNASLAAPLDLKRGSVFFVAANQEVQLNVTQGIHLFRASCKIDIPNRI